MTGARHTPRVGWRPRLHARSRPRPQAGVSAARLTGSNLAQTAVTIIVAVLTGASALLASQASDAWNRSVRDDVKRSAALLEDVRFVYGDEGPRAFDLAVQDARATAGGGPGAATARQVAFSLHQAHAGRGGILDGTRYLAPGRGYDLPRRLADVRAQRPALTALDPGTARDEGDRRSRTAQLVAGAAVPLVALYLAVDLALRARQRRRDRGGASAEEDVGLAPRPWSRPTASRLGAAVALGAWLVVVLVPAVQLRVDSQESRAQALASTRATDTATAIAASGAAASFRTDSVTRARQLGARALGGQIAAMDTLDASTRRALEQEADGDRRTVARAQRIARAMTRPPTAADGVDPVTRAAVNATVRDAKARQVAQNRAVDEADRAGARGTTANLALVLGALALSLSALAAVSGGRSASAIPRVGAALLAGAVLATAAAVLG
jgi:hypothetical protein